MEGLDRTGSERTRTITLHNLKIEAQCLQVVGLSHAGSSYLMAEPILKMKKRGRYNKADFPRIAAMSKKDSKQIMQDFRVRRERQSLAIVVALFLVLLLAMLYKSPLEPAEFSRNTIFLAQAIVIAAFIGFSSFNWRCPSCKKYLGADMNRRQCSKCGSRLR